MTDDPFAVLGLPARAGLTDEDVRAAWRRVAAATHPDREDGGDPARFGTAAAAYVTLRTSFGRGEALADLTEAGRRRRPRWQPRRGAHRAGPGRGRSDERPDQARPAHRAAHAKGAGAGPANGANDTVTNSATAAGAADDGRGDPQTWPAHQAGRTAGVAAALSGLRAAGGYGRLAGSLGYRGLGLSRALAVPVLSADAAAVAAAAAAGITPASIGLLTGAATVTGWALWRRGGPGR